MPYVSSFSILSPIISELYVWRFEIQEMYTQHFETTQVAGSADLMHIRKHSAFYEEWGIFTS